MSWDDPECEPNLSLMRRHDQLVKGFSPFLYFSILSCHRFYIITLFICFRFQSFTCPWCLSKGLSFLITGIFPVHQMTNLRLSSSSGLDLLVIYNRVG
jgi:hypothetical protein